MLTTFFIIIFSLMVNNQQSEEEKQLLNTSIMKSSNKWNIINDDVMGGLSSSKILVDTNTIIFSGDVSLENNGGFASLRSPLKNYNFSEFAGLEIRLKADGKRYSISMKETAYFTGYFYTASFETKNNEWMTVKLPFDQFKLYYFGREINSNAKIPLSKIKEISFLIGDKQKGEFVAEIDYLKLY
jgi:hypothetical protein